MPAIDSGDTAWVLASAAMVLLMTPGLAYFYGGMTTAKSTLNMMMMSFVTIAVVSILWTVYGFSVAFGNGTSSLWGTWDVTYLSDHLSALTDNGGTFPIPLLAFAAFQLMFAVITPALISGAIADRAKFMTWTIFVAIWVTIVYFPVAHWVFDFGGAASIGAGWLAASGVEDFAGGTAVHINAGAAGLALAIVLGRRIGFRQGSSRPHNIPLVLIGAGLLWFGWFGFNAGSALAANGTAATALYNTQVAAAAAIGGWLLVERLRDGHATAMGAASGAVAGLVAITPACAFIEPYAAVILGLVAGAICAGAVGLKYRFNYDDTLDVVGIHLVGGIVGCLFIGFFGAAKVLGTDGLLYGGGFHLLEVQAKGAFAVMAYSFAVTFVIASVLDKTIGFRISRAAELEGIDSAEHAEMAYDHAGGFDDGPGGGAPRTTVSVTDGEGVRV